MTRAFIFTINNWNDKHVKKLSKETNVVYMVYAKEVGDKGTPHLQGYIYYKNHRSSKAIQKRVGGFFYEAFGEAEDSRQYVIGPYKKNGKVKPYNPNHVEIGTIPKQGKRNDLNHYLGTIDLDTDVDELLLSHPEMIRFEKWLRRKKALLLKAQKKFTQLQTTVLWGPAGSGKTRHVYEKHGHENVYTLEQSDHKIWWDGYDGQKVLLIDDFYGWIKYGMLLKLLDGYPMRLPTKGGHTYKGWDTVYITSNVEPDHWYLNGVTPALKRRLHTILEKLPEVD